MKLRDSIIILCGFAAIVGCAPALIDQKSKNFEQSTAKKPASPSSCNEVYLGMDSKDFRSHQVTASGASSLETKYALHEVVERAVKLLRQCPKKSNVPLRKFLDSAYRNDTPHPLPATLNRHVFRCSDLSKSTYLINLDGLCGNGYAGKLEASGFGQSDRPISTDTNARIIREKDSKILFENVDQLLRELDFIPQKSVRPSAGHFPSLLVHKPYFNASRQMGLLISFHSRKNALEDQRSVTGIVFYRKIER